MSKKEKNSPLTRSELQEETGKIDKKIDRVAAELLEKTDKLDKKIDRVAIKLLNVDSRLEKVEEFLKTQATTKEDHQEIIKYLDEIVHLNEHVNRRMDGHDTRIGDHEDRSYKLEKSS